MQDDQRSRTIQIPAIMRALHQTTDDDPKILTDPVAPRLIEIDKDREWLAPMLEHPFAKGWRAGFALRARYAEDCLAEAVQRDVSQYAILGAGLDTFPYRQPSWGRSLRIYELDHPATQQWKRDRLKDADIAVPCNVRFVPADFETTSISEALSRSDFAFRERTLCSCMGVTQYLRREALDAILRFVLSLPPASEIAFSFILPQEAVSGIEAAALTTAAERAAGAGEPWLTRLYPNELKAQLRLLGFSRVIHLTPDEARELYFHNRRDGLRERHGEQLMRAIV